MKKPIMWVAALLTASCTPALKVEVANTTPTERDDETVEIAWSEVAALKGVTPDNIVVLNDDNEQIPSQVLFRGGTEPQALIFQTDADPMESKRFKLVAGQRENYPAEAFGRTVPERYDDYAWENNKVAYRLYGPALETSPEKLVTPGIDVWVKCTDKLVIDEWYARGNYHHNYGDGMDCYKVGVTLGSGASLPFAGGKFWMMGHNYATARTLDNGPIRTSVELTYAPFDVDGTPVTLTKVISLDANQRFNRMDNIYEGAFAEMPIAAGFVRHDVKQILTGEGWMALCEAVSDSKEPVRDGDIYLGVILPGAEMLTDTLGHAVAVKAVKPGRTLTYYAGSGWSQGGVEDMKEWIEEIGQAQAARDAAQSDGPQLKIHPKRAGMPSCFFRKARSDDRAFLCRNPFPKRAQPGLRLSGFLCIFVTPISRKSWTDKRSLPSGRSCCGSRRPTTCVSTRRTSSAPATAEARPTSPYRWPTTACKANSSPACRTTGWPTPASTTCAATAYGRTPSCAAASGSGFTTWRRPPRCARRTSYTTAPTRPSTPCNRG